MRSIALLVAGLFPMLCHAAAVEFDTPATHVIVVRPIDSWDPDKFTASYSLDSLREKSFKFEYVDSNGAVIAPKSGGMFSDKVSTPLSEEVKNQMASGGFKIVGSHVYRISAPWQVEPGKMSEFTKAQNQLYRAAVIKQGDPTELGSRIAAKKTLNVFATIAVAKFGIDKFGGLDPLTLSAYSSLYTDIDKLLGGASAALLPISLPEYDFSEFNQVEIRRVTDNAAHVGEIIIGYRQAKTADDERAALSKAIVAAGGVGTTVQDIEATRAKSYEQRLAIWSECQRTPGCVSQ
jgi:hypothetical protein